MQQRLPIPLPKAKFGSPGDSKEEGDDDATTAADDDAPGPFFQHTATVTATLMILWDVFLCPYFLSVIKGIVSFKFGSVCCRCTGWLSFFFLHVLGVF